jgi:hypothetical protein
MTFLEGGDTCHNNENRPEQRFHFWKPRLCRHGKTSCMVAGVGLCWSDKLNFNNSLRQGYKPLHDRYIWWYPDLHMCTVIWVMTHERDTTLTENSNREQLEDRPSKLYNSRWLPESCVLWVEWSVLHLENVSRRELDPIIAFPVRTETFRVLYLIALPLSQPTGHWAL